MTKHKNESITLELPAYLVDMLADWARTDAEVMGPIAAGSDKKKLNDKRMELADAFSGGVLNQLSAMSAEGDIAEAINERDAAYATYRTTAYTK